MKKTFIYLFILLCFACRSKQDYTLCGILHVDSNTVVDMLGIQTEDTLLYVKADSAGYFSTTIPFQEVAFCNLFGITVTGEERWQFTTPIALHPGKLVHLDFCFADNQAVIIASDPENRALQAFRQWSEAKSRSLWRSLPGESDIADSLALFPGEACRIIAEVRPEKLTADYLVSWANVEYLNLAYSLYGGKIPAALVGQLPAVPQVLDVPYWQLFYGSDLYIIEYLQRSAQEPDAQMCLLQEQFLTPSIRTKITRRLIEHYISHYSYSEENEALLARFCADQSDKERLIKQFRDKRYASPGAPLPDAVFEDKNGQEHRLTEFAGKYIYIDLWASWCGPCVAEVPHLQKLEKELNRRDIVFVSISLDTKRENWEKQIEQLHMHGNQWLVRDEAFANMMNVKGIPHFLLYGKDGTLLDYKAFRPSSGEMLKSRLEHLP